MASSRWDNRCASDSASESDSSLPWLWSIQYAASCKEMDLSTLQSLVDLAPVAKDDFCEKTRELISLRCLEAIFYSDSAHRVDYCDDAAAASLDSRVQFDFSTSCEDALRQIVGEVPLPNLIKGRAKLLKWDVSQFILHKRTAIKCDLVQLKESICDGTHPYADRLKEIGILQPQNGGNQEHVNDNAHCDVSEKDNGNSSYHANKEVKENSISIMLDKVTRPWKELLEKIKPSKRNRVESVNANEHMMGCQQGKEVVISELDAFQGTAKKIRCDASLNVKSAKEKPISHGNDRWIASKQFNSSSHNEVLDHEPHIPFSATMSLQHKSGGEYCQQQEDEPISHGNDRWIASKQFNSSSHNEVLDHEPQIPFSATMSLQHKSGGEYCQQQEDEPISTEVLPLTGILHGNKNDTAHEVPNVIGELQSKRTEALQVRERNPTVDEAVEHTVNGCVIETSSHEKMESDDDISESSSLKETIACMRCKKEDGELLVCKTTTCSTVIHASCVTTSPHFDAEGDFFCPYCVYAKSISRYIQSVKKVILARQELVKFICKDV
ncbi:hypothetical protein PIB30_031604 [Stylosanthes scabra]|uniref:PHD-type domain-containing protein n=1 Tax=Stylosanthes scabra TaxID=79078 RepID=A0ABU6TDT7_9FABA|nr:hypothetical protein [Stylosanthes scabra]